MPLALLQWPQLRADFTDVEIYELDKFENIEARLTELKKSGHRIN